MAAERCRSAFWQERFVARKVAPGRSCNAARRLGAWLDERFYRSITRAAGLHASARRTEIRHGTARLTIAASHVAPLLARRVTESPSERIEPRSIRGLWLERDDVERAAALGKRRQAAAPTGTKAAPDLSGLVRSPATAAGRPARLVARTSAQSAQVRVHTSSVWDVAWVDALPTTADSDTDSGHSR